MRIIWMAVLSGALASAQQVNFYSPEKEAALGKQLAAGYREHRTMITSPVVEDYVDRVGRRIAADMQDGRLPFAFAVMEDDPCATFHEPVALPGGYIFVPARLIVEAREEAEFAGMLAHAMAHVALRHGMRQDTATIPLIFLGGWAGSCGPGQAVPLALQESLRRNEAEADVLAMEAMAHAGFDPAALVRYVERAKAAEAGTEFLDVQQEVRRLITPPPRKTAPPTLRRQ